MTIPRFTLYWLVDYSVASIVVFTLGAAANSIWDFSWMGNVIYFFIPVSTLFFSYFAFHRAKKGPDAKFKIALAWTILAVLFDTLIVMIFYHLNPLSVLLTPVIIVIYVSKFIAVYLAAFLAHRYELKHGQSINPINFLGNETPSPRSE